MVEAVKPVQRKRDQGYKVAHRVNQDAVQSHCHEHFNRNPRKTLFFLDLVVELSDGMVDNLGAHHGKPNVYKVQKPNVYQFYGTHQHVVLKRLFRYLFDTSEKKVEISRTASQAEYNYMV
jgi:hypothetical protein